MKKGQPLLSVTRSQIPAQVRLSRGKLWQENNIVNPFADSYG